MQSFFIRLKDDNVAIAEWELVLSNLQAPIIQNRHIWETSLE